MSTTIDIYPTNDYLPLVEQTRARTEELFQALLDRYQIGSTVEVKAIYPRTENTDNKEIRYVGKSVRWKPGLEIVFAYWINGRWNSSSWPTCELVDHDELDGETIGSGKIIPDCSNYSDRKEFLESCYTYVALENKGMTTEMLDALIDHCEYCWWEYRNAGGPAVASTGYGLVAAAIAEQTNGLIVSFDSAFDHPHNGETAEQLLSWWGDNQINFYSPDAFR